VCPLSKALFISFLLISTKVHADRIAKPTKAPPAAAQEGGLDCKKFADENPDIADLLHTSPVPPPYVSLRTQGRLCFEGFKGAWSDTLKTLLTDPYTYMAKTSPEATRKALAECSESIQCLETMYFDAKGYSPSPTEREKLKRMGFRELDILNRQAIARMNSSYMQDKRLREKLENEKWLDKKSADVQVVHHPKQEQNSFWAAVASGLSHQGHKFRCLKPEVKTEYFCYYLAQIIDPLMAAGIVAKAPAVGRLLKAAGKTRVARKNYLDIPISDKAPVHAKLRAQSTQTLERIVKDEEFAAKMAKETGQSVKVTQRDSAILLSKGDDLNRTAGEIVSRETMAREAAYLNHKLEPLEQVYRLDQRSPDEIAKTGFKPNPQKDPGTLWEHTRKGHPGTGNYVSTSVQETNPKTLLNSDFWDGSRQVKGTDPMQVKAWYDKPQKLDDFEYVRYEYRIKNSEGVVLRGADYADEQEAVIRFARPEQIEFREIRIQQRWVEEIQDGEYMYNLTPIRKIDPVKDVKASGWQSLPRN